MDFSTVTQPAVPVMLPQAHGGPVYDVDRGVQRVLQGTALHEMGSLNAAVRTLNWWGGPGVIWCAAAVWLGARAAGRRSLSTVALRGAEAIALSSAVSGLVKGFSGRSRPFLSPGEPWHWSFAHGWTDARYFSMPSGHTTTAFAFAAAVSAAAAHWLPVRRAVLSAISFAAALGVGFARIYLDQHWMSDVLAGALLGGVTGVALVRWHARHEGSAFDRVLLGAAEPVSK